MKPTTGMLWGTILLPLVSSTGCVGGSSLRQETNTPAASQPVSLVPVGVLPAPSATPTVVGNANLVPTLVTTLDTKVIGLAVEQVAPYGVIGLLLAWLVLQSVMHKRVVRSHNGTVKQLTTLVHYAVKFGREALQSLPPDGSNQEVSHVHVPAANSDPPNDDGR